MTTPDPLQDLREMLIRLDTKLDLLIAAKNDHEARIRKLEAGRWPLPSLAALVSLASLIVAFLAAAGVFK